MRRGGPAALAVALGAVAATEAVWRAFDRPPLALAALVALAGVAPVALVRLWPAAAALLSAAATLSGLLVSYPVTVAGACAPAVLYAAAGYRRPLRIAAPLVLPFVVYAAVPVALDRPGGRPVALVLLAIAALATAAGAARRQRDEHRRHRAAEESAAASLLEFAARGERARIVRELHDVVAHHITMIALQAEAARLATPGLPPDGARRLTAIGDTARTALTEMRRLLGVLREDVDADSGLEPQPGLHQLNTLLDEARDAGLGGGVRLIVSGAVQSLDPGVELAAYRIVQEALTNARRHAVGAAVDVELRYHGEELVVRVYDNGPGPAPQPGHGHGLTGMRERAAVVGGQVTAGAAPGCGFLVEAVLPTKGDTG
ncbi:sensor histidine kinase [Cryptosporangium aurantiacum]|uniref:sensor histidine kinase n=1 Tax=Cryptosporangium aurantiacum TaxID=134849 RepID=UPI000932FD43|nr:sensor histidine kinase [Cryptosporangium aurantiacum]